MVYNCDSKAKPAKGFFIGKKMLENKVLPTRTLEMMRLSGRSVETDRQRRTLFGHMYGPSGREFYRGLRDGSLIINDLPRFKDAIDAHFFATIRREYSIPEDIRAKDFYTDLQGIGIGVVRRFVGEAFPYLGRKLGEFKNEILFKAPSPTALFRVLVLDADEVDQRLVFEATRQLIIADTAGPLYVRSKHADLNQRLSDWNDILNEELYERPYGAGKDYELHVYHDNQTNRVVRFHPANESLKPPKEGEHLATHNFLARRMKSYGWVYVDVAEVGVVDATIQALIAAANNRGNIQSIQDGKIGINMTFVDLEDNLGKYKGGNHRMRHLTALKARVMEVMLRHLDIADIKTLPASNTIEIYDRGLPEVPIRLEFLNRIDYLDKNYDVGVKANVKGIPGTVFNGEAEKLSDLRSYYPLVKYLLPRELYGDTQDSLLMTMDKVAARLKEECTFTVDHFNSLQAILNQSTT